MCHVHSVPFYILLATELDQTTAYYSDKLDVVMIIVDSILIWNYHRLLKTIHNNIGYAVIGLVKGSRKYF